MKQQIKLSYTHDFTEAKPAVHVEIVADDHAQALDSLISLAKSFGGDPPWRAKVSLSKLAKAVTKADVKKDASLANDYARDEALKLLVKTYSHPETRDETRGLLDKYGITKFGDISLDRAHELLKDAQRIHQNWGGGGGGDFFFL
jgi:hypothetical protein